MATATKKTTGFGLVCPLCNEPGAAIRMNLNDIHEEIECNECNETFSVLAAIDLFSTKLAAWTKLRRFLDSAVKAIETDDDTAF